MANASSSASKVLVDVSNVYNMCLMTKNKEAGA